MERRQKSKKKRITQIKTEIDPMMETEYMSWNKKQLIHQIKNRDRGVERLMNEVKVLEGLLERALVMLPSNPNYGAAWDAPVRHVCDNLRAEIKTALNK